jgi:hypothetical protein
VEGNRSPFSTPVSPESLAADVVLFERELGEDAAGVDGLASLAARSRLGRALRLLGRPEDAVALTEVNVAACTRQLGASHPDTLTPATIWPARW